MVQQSSVLSNAAAANIGASAGSDGARSDLIAIRRKERLANDL